MQNMKNKNGYLQTCGSLKKAECHLRKSEKDVTNSS